MKFSQNTKQNRKKYYGTKIYDINLTENVKSYILGVRSIFDQEQHKCDPQMNNTRGLIPPKPKQLSSQYDVILLRPLP